MNEVVLLPADSGFDLDDDGTPDNALALLFFLPVLFAVFFTLGGAREEEEALEGFASSGICIIL